MALLFKVPKAQRSGEIFFAVEKTGLWEVKNEEKRGRRTAAAKRRDLNSLHSNLKSAFQRNHSYVREYSLYPGIGVVKTLQTIIREIYYNGIRLGDVQLAALNYLVVEAVQQRCNGWTGEIWNITVRSRARLPASWYSVRFKQADLWYDSTRKTE